MQNKGLITVFAILFGVVSLYQLMFTFIANNVEDDAKAYATSKFEATQPKERNEAEAKYLDSIETIPQFLGIDYKTAKEKELNKGLDLKGGINVILQISVKDILKGLANNTKDGAFNQALLNADELQKNSQSTYLESFFQAFEALPGENRLASPDIFFNKTLEGQIESNMTNNQVKPVISRKIDESIASAFEVLRKRIDKFGVTQPNIQRLGNSGRILVELPGAKDVERIKVLLQSTAQLEFWEVVKEEAISPFIINADKKIAELLAAEKKEAETPSDTTQTEEDEELSNILGGDNVEENLEEGEESPLLSKILPARASNPGFASFALKDTAVINGYLKMPQVRALLDGDLRFTRFVWSIPEYNESLGEEITSLYAIKGNRDNVPQLSGGVIVDAQQSYNQAGRVSVTMQMNGVGAKIWEDMTEYAYQNGTQIAVVLDNIVYSAPGVSSGKISGGRSEITGDFSVTEAQDLANVLRAGKLPASADIIQAEVVGPTLGHEAINSGMISFVIALIIVLLWMIFYYGKAGAFADVALLVNLLFIFGILAGLGAVLTLPGIAGIVLTIGMSVDANVLIFERIREELDKGKAQRDAINDGFNNALSSILDANITTGLTGLILLVFGTGPIQGFATTLLIGICTSLFTAIFVTRLFIDRYTKNGKPLTCATALTKNLLKNVNIKFLEKRKIAYIISGILILISLISLFTKGLNQGIDFVGGRTYTVRFDHDVNSLNIQEGLIATFGSAEAKTFGASNQLKISTKYKIDQTGSDVDKEVETMLYESLKAELPSEMTYDQFISDDENKLAGRMEYYKVSPTIADDIKTSSFWAVLGSLVVVFLYILLRFRRWQFSLGAVVAVFHDVLIVLGVFSLTYSFMPFNMEIDQSFIAAILTVIGYSLNDTVIVFDRIREYFNEHSSWKMHKIINAALNSTLSRTLNTSMTTLIVLLCMFFIGAESIRGLLFAIIVGIFVGTYSSLFIATPIFFDTVKKRGIDLSDKKEEIEKEK
ncbi:MAG TPA: protein translocase subunit SecDF [Flavobacteriaceae bacterium]|nr:protein translocase subunit SecDF [Flavobacteriaceae bacterium]HPF11343.1 protein translocase subunit SecDF [Flavobacteriaceae bacterium]HQU20506.1 protein translocase subunit SecDF [Flavobacteriaceae bacterium]HQU65861.1 protein translocase subunit SecDF [Flavobacteriaceae bacterium]HRW44159.1 protein translocase subunit SecDF [Flavobacteriaceae bacterium]